MAPKATYTYERFAGVAAQSASKARGEYASPFIEHLGCDVVKQPAQLKRSSEVAFQWRFRGAGYDETCEVKVRCNHVLDQGVPLPEAWVTALRALSLDHVAAQSAEKIQNDEPGLSEVRCEVLGFPTVSRVEAQGKIVALSVGGERVVYFLCTQIAGSSWFVHRGSYKDTGELEEDAFQEKDLDVKDIEADAFDEKQRKRLRTSPAVNTLRWLVQSKDYTWRRLLAIAHFRAQEQRATTQPFDTSGPARGFERNPFGWDVGQGRQSQINVTFLWTWRAGAGVLHRAFVSPSLNHVLQRGAIPYPQGMCQQDAETLRKLQSAADVEVRESKVPCLYLGLETSPGNFEQDPLNWPPELVTEGKARAHVSYEWQHVSRSGLPHRVVCTVNNLLHHGRRVPLNPLRSCPTNLTFSLEWMQAVADNVRAGIVYKGIAYESERPDLVLELPNDGIDVQRETAHWVLPDGRCVAWTVLELAEKRPDELEDPTARELYFAIGKELDCYPLGTLPDEHLEAYREAPGTLEERLRLSVPPLYITKAWCAMKCQY